MSNFNINNTLAELEDNLKKMDSARSQVSNLSQLVSQLTEAYADTLGQLKKIESSIHYDEKYFEKKFGKSINELDTNINLLQSKVVDHNNSVNSIHEKASKDFINSLKKSEEKVKLYIDDIKPTLEKVQTEFKNKNEEIIVDLKQKINEVIETSSEKINEITPILEKVQTEFKNENEQIIVDLKQKIKEVVEVSSDKINEIKGLDLLKEINSIENTTIEINSNLQKVFALFDSIEHNLVTNIDKIFTENQELKTNTEFLKNELQLKFDNSDSKINQINNSLDNIEEKTKKYFNNIISEHKELANEIQILKKESNKGFNNTELNFENILTENKELKNEIKNLKSELNSRFEKSDTNFKILLAAIVVTLLVTIVMKFI